MHKRVGQSLNEFLLKRDRKIIHTHLCIYLNIGWDFGFWLSELKFLKVIISLQHFELFEISMCYSFLNYRHQRHTFQLLVSGESPSTKHFVTVRVTLFVIRIAKISDQSEAQISVVAFADGAYLDIASLSLTSDLIHYFGHRNKIFQCFSA